MTAIREYKPDDERGWLECRVLSFLDSAYYDDVVRQKPSYLNPTIDLVAESDKKIVGFIEVECDLADGTTCYQGPYPAGMIWNIGVLPEHRRDGIATKLLDEAKRMALEKGVNRFEAFTRDDQFVHRWYEKNGFHKVMSYLHVYLNYDELQEFGLRSKIGLSPHKMFAHYLDDDIEAVRHKYERVHDCVLFELRF